MSGSLAGVHPPVSMNPDEAQTNVSVPFLCGLHPRSMGQLAVDCQ